ncbi:hypothetical protein HPB52_023071 [Rhipicephalus sanguineus]|uniref:Peptidase M13 N-terminal domain-containing protein n=1 Tax=Rhipicephalus sanguineus TaxID=34632 RepID=A0A9D4ST16_RHISA|nr:hypothetical protein HPB52_023071 [Rhipicephalus sanguineus]
MFAIAVFAFRHLRLTIEAERPDPCGTDDCLLHAMFLKRHLNATSDPCDNLYAYVCGGSLGLRQAVTNETVEDEVMRLYAEDLAHDASRRPNSATEGLPDQVPAENAVASLRESGAFKTCLERSSKEPEAFTRFMKERGIPWPRRTDPDGVAVTKSTVLEVLFDLTVNWKVSLWFDLRVFRAVGNATTLVFREPGPLVMLRRKQLRGVESLAIYSSLVRRVAAFLQKDDRATLTGDDVSDLYEKDTSMRSMLDAFSDDNGEDELSTLKKIAALAAVNVTSLLTILEKRLPATDSAMQESTAVVVFNERLLRAVFSLLSRLSTKEALDLIGWTFAYTYVWIVNSDFDRLSPLYDDHGHRVGDVDNRTLCFHAVQESFGLLRITPVWQDPGLLDSIYAMFPETYSSFFDAWLATRDAGSSAGLSSVYEHPAVTGRYRWRSKRIRYLSSTNMLLPRIAALYPPSHYPHGSVTMSYAGLGFQVAENTIGAIVDRGRGVDNTRAKRFWWSASERCQWDQARSAHEKAHVRRRFALRIATEALERNVAGSLQDAFVQLKSMEQMSGRQTFYASFCSHFCGEPDGEDTCNVALEEESFQDSFGCRWWWSKFGSDPTCLIV